MTGSRFANELAAAGDGAVGGAKSLVAFAVRVAVSKRPGRGSIEAGIAKTASNSASLLIRRFGHGQSVEPLFGDGADRAAREACIGVLA